MRFLFRGNKRREELSQLTERARGLEAEIERLEQTIQPSNVDDEAASTYGSVQRLRSAMVNEELTERRAELAQLRERIAQLEARIYGSRGRPAPPPEPAPVEPPIPAATVAQAGPPVPPAPAASTPAEPSRPPESTTASSSISDDAPPTPAQTTPPATAQLGESASPGAPSTTPPPGAPAQRPPLRAQVTPLARPTAPVTQPGRGNGRQRGAPARRQVKTAAGWRGSRWINLLLILAAMGAFTAGGLYVSGLAGNEARSWLTSAAQPPVRTSAPSPSPVGSPTLPVAVLPTQPPTSTPVPTATVPPPTATPELQAAEATAAPPGVLAESPTVVPAASPEATAVQPTPEATVAAELTVTPTTPPTRTPTAVPATPTPSAVPTPAGPERAAAIAVVDAPSGFSGALLRSEPTLRAPSQRFLPNGTIVEVLDGSSTADDFRWSRVRTDDGTVGWVVSLTIGR